MPSILTTTVGSTTVGANAYKNPGTFSQFGTRDLTFIKVAVTGGSNDMRYQDGATSTLSYTLTGSLFSKAVNVLQGFGEVYYVGAPAAGGFVAAISTDTAQSADSGNTANGGFGLLESAINAALNASAATTVTALSPTATTIA